MYQQKNTHFRNQWQWQWQNLYCPEVFVYIYTSILYESYKRPPNPNVVYRTSMSTKLIIGTYKAMNFTNHQIPIPSPATRVAFRSIIVGLLSHQLLVQTVGSLLLQGSSNMVASELSMMPAPGTEGATEPSKGDLIQDRPLPGEWFRDRIVPLHSPYEIMVLLKDRWNYRFIVWHWEC